MPNANSLFRVWTRVNMSISNNGNHYTTATSWYIYIYIYICQDTRDTLSWDRNTADSYIIWRFYCTAIRKFNVSEGILTHMYHFLLQSWQQHPTRHQLYGHLPPITKTIQVRRTRHAGHCWRSRDELIRDVLLWIPTHGRAKAGRPARTYIQQLCEDTGCCPEDLPRAMNDREEWRERVRDIRAASTIWWWWYIYIYAERQPSAQFNRRALHYVSGNRQFLHQTTPPLGEYV